MLAEGKDIAIFAIGNMVYNAKQVIEKLKQNGIRATLINMNTLKPLDIHLKNLGTNISDNGVWEMDIINGVPTQGFYNFNVTSIWPEVIFDVSGIYL